MKHSVSRALEDIVARFPTTRDEDWKYTDLSIARDISSRWIAAGARHATALVPEYFDTLTASIDAYWIVVANGRFERVPEIDGVTIEKLGEVRDVASDALAEFNASLLQESLRIGISASPDKPLGLLVVDAADETAVSQAWLEVRVDAGCAAGLVEYHSSTGSADHYANTALKIDLGERARLDHVRIQTRDRGHVQTHRTTVAPGEDAVYRMAGFDLGGRLIRNDLVIDLAARRAEVAFEGLYLAGDGQHIDNHTRVDHRVGPAMSRQEYRGILNGRCRCVWNGKAIVHDGADGTDAAQANHNLLLSDKAEIDAKPELEIYADDVKCSHGTTVGQLDETALFYLRSRGIDRHSANRMLTRAFASGLVSRIPVAAAIETVDGLVEQRLGELMESRRTTEPQR